MEKKKIDGLYFETPNLSISPQKVNIVIKSLKQFFNYPLLKMISILEMKGRLLKKSSNYICKILKILTRQLLRQEKNIDDYFISEIFVKKSFIRKKISYRARGRTDIVRRRWSRIVIALSTNG